MIYVAVVDRGGSYRSDRPDGDWAAFIGEDREEVIRQALAARNKWGRSKYRVLIGELTAEARERVQYRIVSL